MDPTSRSPRSRSPRAASPPWRSPSTDWSPPSISLTSEGSSHNDADRELLGHFGSYEHRESPFVQESPYRIVNESKPIHVLPSSVVLFINMHGRTAEPFLTPLRVTRNIGTDFGTCFFGKPTDRKPVFFEGLGTTEGETLKQNIKEIMRESRCRVCEMNAHVIELEERLKRLTEQAEDNLRRLGRSPPTPREPTADEIQAALDKQEIRQEFEEFKNSKYHEKEKKFKKGMPMFNKLLGMTGPSGIRESHETHSIYVRADLSKRLQRDVYFEIRTEKTSLKDILDFLVNKGVKHVTLFDLSCSGDERESIHRTRYGGH